MFITYRFCQDWEFRALKIQAQFSSSSMSWQMLGTLRIRHKFHRKSALFSALQVLYFLTTFVP
jgi:hypothetical protein